METSTSSTTSSEHSFMTSAKWVLHAFTLAWNLLTTIFELLFQVLFSHKDASLNLQSFDPLQTIEQTLNKTEELPIDVRSSTENCSVAHEVLIQPTPSPVNVEHPIETPIIESPPSNSDLHNSSEIPSDKADSSSSEDESLDQPSELAAGKSAAPSDEKKKRKRRRGKKKKATQEGDAATPVAADSAEVKPVEKKPAQAKAPKKDKSPAKSPAKLNDKSPAKNGQAQSRSNGARPSSLFNNNRWDTHDTDRWEHKRFSHSVLKTTHDETSSSMTIRPIRQPIGPSANSNGFSEEYRKSRLAALVKANSEQFHAKNAGLPISKALSV